jgi:NAD(P)H-dependent FMN reductase
MNFLIFVGTTRDSTPPAPSRLGLRVAQACLDFLKNHCDISLELIDPLDYPVDGVFKPHFAYRKSDAPEMLGSLAKKIESADGYVMISPEYNHSMSPALAHLLNHFGSSLFSYKPSAIVTYSAGQWGGVRAAVGMRSFLSELGCLPVSAMIHIPQAQNVFSENGTVQDGVDRDQWYSYFDRTFSQLFWWAESAKTHRSSVNPNKIIADFKRDPSQRNAP